MAINRTFYENSTFSHFRDVEYIKQYDLMSAAIHESHAIIPNSRVPLN